MSGFEGSQWLGTMGIGRKLGVSLLGLASVASGTHMIAPKAYADDARSAQQSGAAQQRRWPGATVQGRPGACGGSGR